MWVTTRHIGLALAGLAGGATLGWLAVCSALVPMTPWYWPDWVHDWCFRWALLQGHGLPAIILGALAGLAIAGFAVAGRQGRPIPAENGGKSATPHRLAPFAGMLLGGAVGWLAAYLALVSWSQDEWAPLYFLLFGPLATVLGAIAGIVVARRAMPAR